MIWAFPSGLPRLTLAASKPFQSDLEVTNSPTELSNHKTTLVQESTNVKEIFLDIPYEFTYKSTYEDKTYSNRLQ